MGLAGCGGFLRDGVSSPGWSAELTEGAEKNNYARRALMKALLRVRAGDSGGLTTIRLGIPASRRAASTSAPVPMWNHHLQELFVGKRFIVAPPVSGGSIGMRYLTSAQ